jgi:5-methyltetrahydrofolate--homocysteine methyltransferase
MHTITRATAALDPDLVHLCERALSAGEDPQEVLDAVTRGLDEIGRQYETGVCFLPELLAAEELSQGVLTLLRPHLSSTDTYGKATMVIGTVKGDFHDIGKNVVSAILQSLGIEVFDLGVDVTADTFVHAVLEHKPAFLGMSALLTTSMPEMARVIEELKAKGLRQGVKVLVGGRPVTEEYAQEIGADGYAPDAIAAKSLVARMLDTITD